MLNRILIWSSLLCLVCMMTGCATESAAKKDLAVQMETKSGICSKIERFFDEGVLTFEQGSYQLAQVNFSEVIKLEKELPDKKWTAKAHEYLQQIKVIEPSALPKKLEKQMKIFQQEKIDELLTAAKGLYSDKKYEDTIAKSREVLKIDIDNKSARKRIIKSRKAIEKRKAKELKKKRKAEKRRIKREAKDKAGQEKIAEKKEPCEVSSPIKQLFDEGVSAFGQSNYQLAQMNLSEVIELEKNLSDKKYTAKAQGYLQQIKIIEPSALPEEQMQILPEEDVAEMHVDQEIKQRLGEKISLKFRDAEIKELLSSFSTSYGINIICDKDVQGKVSVELKDVTVEEALKAILDISGYRYVRKDNIIYVENISKGKISRIFTIGYTDPSTCKEMASELLSSQGTIKIDETFNRLVVTDLPANIDEIEKFIKNFDSRIPQALIEVKIVDVTLTDLLEVGVEWSATYTGKDIFGVGARSGTAETTKGTYTQRGPGAASLPTTQFDIAVALTRLTDLSVKVDALISNQKADLLANPRIITQNNQEARIIIGEKVPYKEKTTTTTGTLETTKFIDVGTTLKVTPKISHDGYITLKIHPEVSSVTSLIDNQPRMDTREADTTVTVKDGQTIAIGGLIKETTSVTNRKIPLLGDIPLLGYLFRSKGESKEKKELIIFITPHIIRYPD